MIPRTIACTLLSAVLLWACSDKGATEIVVSVTTDLRIPAELTELTLKVQRAGGVTLKELSYALDPATSGHVKLPATLGLVAGEDPSAGLTVTATGRKGGKDVVKRRAVTRFLEQRVLLLRLDLERACVGKICTAGQTCVAGSCRSEVIDPVTLPGYSKAAAFPDGGRPSDSKPDRPLTGDLKPPGDTTGDRPETKCGNGTIDSGEQCDGSKMGSNASCSAQGFSGGGALTSCLNCKYDTSPCYKLLDKAQDLLLGTKSTTTDSQPALAHTGNRVLVLWQSSATGTSLLNASLWDSSGVAQKAAHMLCLQSGASGRMAPAASGGPNFLLAWTRQVPSGKFFALARTMDTSGKILGSSGCVSSNISSSTKDKSASSVAYNGTDYLVVWHDRRHGNTRIYGRRLDTSGAPLGSDIAVMDDASMECNEPDVAAGGTDFLVVAHCAKGSASRNIHGARVDGKGAVSAITPAFTSHAEDQQYPAVAYGGKNFLVVWSDRRSGVANSDIWGRQVTTSGTVGSDFRISQHSDPDNNPDVAYNGAGKYLVVWKKGKDPKGQIRAKRLDSAAKILDNSSLVLSNSSARQDYPAVTAYGANFFVAWEDQRNSIANSDIYGARVQP